jgi:hypothetical protein
MRRTDTPGPGNRDGQPARRERVPLATGGAGARASGTLSRVNIPDRVPILTQDVFAQGGRRGVAARLPRRRHPLPAPLRVIPKTEPLPVGGMMLYAVTDEKRGVTEVTE